MSCFLKGSGVVFATSSLGYKHPENMKPLSGGIQQGPLAWPFSCDCCRCEPTPIHACCALRVRPGAVPLYPIMIPRQEWHYYHFIGKLEAWRGRTRSAVGEEQGGVWPGRAERRGRQPPGSVVFLFPLATPSCPVLYAASSVPPACGSTPA